MLRTFITTTEPYITLQIPMNMIGKKIEIIAFEIEEDIPKEKELFKNKIDRIQNITKNYLTDMSNFHFNRNDANQYE